MTDGEYTSCVDQYADAVFRFLIKNLKNRADVEDLVQITFEKVWRNREKVDVNSAKSYLKSVLMLRDYEGYSYAEIAELTELTESQVKVYIYRARKKMKQYIVQLDNVL